MSKKENRIKNTVYKGVTYIQIDEVIICNIKMKSKFNVGEWLPIMDAYLFVYDSLIQQLDFVVSKVNEGKVKIYEIDSIADTSWVGYGKSYKERM